MSGQTMARLADVAQKRWGLFTAAQAVHAHVSRNTLTRLTAGGVLVHVAHGVYRMAGAPELEHEGIYATWLALGGATRPTTSTGVSAVVAGGITAAVLHGIGDFFPDGGDFIVPARRATRLQARLRVRSLVPTDVTFAESVPVLTVERTIADLVEIRTDRSLIADTIASAHMQGRIVDAGRIAEYLDPTAGANGFIDGAEFAADLFALAGIRAPVPRRHH